VAVTEFGLLALGELQLLRIVQEALANVRKHAEANNVDVSICSSDGMVELTVADNGTGFVAGARARPGDDTTPHFGLSTMRERAESGGGTLEVQSTPGSGTRVVVRLPVGAPSAAAGRA
jgi:signal transduction histidine kinase